jgi:hypothetical protein
MNIAIFSLLVCGLFAGAAQAENAPAGFDRVGLAGAKPVAVQPTRQAAPGETRRVGDDALPERRREMARRLVWLMLSAR